MGEHSLRGMILADTGCDPATEPAFAWSNDLACDRCGRIATTAAVSFDGDTTARLCGDCYRII